MNPFRTLAKPILSLLAAGVLLTNGCALPHAQLRYSKAEPKFYCPGEMIQTSYDLGACMTHSGITCESRTPTVTLTTTSAALPSQTFTAFTGSASFTPSEPNVDVTYTVTPKKPMYPFVTSSGENRINDREFEPETTKLALINGEAQVTLNHNGICNGRIPMNAPSQIPTTPTVSARARAGHLQCQYGPDHGRCGRPTGGGERVRLARARRVPGAAAGQRRRYRQRFRAHSGRCAVSCDPNDRARARIAHPGRIQLRGIRKRPRREAPLDAPRTARIPSADGACSRDATNRRLSVRVLRTVARSGSRPRHHDAHRRDRWPGGTSKQHADRIGGAPNCRSNSAHRSIERRASSRRCPPAFGSRVSVLRVRSHSVSFGRRHSTAAIEPSFD